jgi:hypothetical protein
LYWESSFEERQEIVVSLYQSLQSALAFGSSQATSMQKEVLVEVHLCTTKVKHL